MKLIQCANGVHVRADKVLGITWKMALEGYSIQVLLPDNTIVQVGNFDTKADAVDYANEIAELVNKLNAEETS